MRPILRLPQVDPAQVLIAEIHIQYAVNQSVAKGDVFTPKSFPNSVFSTQKADPTPFVDPSNLVSGSVLRFGKSSGEAARANRVSTCRNRHFQSLMGSLGIVFISPPVKPALTRCKVKSFTVPQNLGFKSSMKPFVFAQGLRVVWTAVDYLDSQANHPHY